MLKETWMLAIETLSWMEMQRLSERLALTRAVKQLDIQNSDAIRLAYMLVCETARRRNLIDEFINAALEKGELGDFSLGAQAFLRLYVYQTRLARNWSGFCTEEGKSIAKLARSILGWKDLQEVEHVLGILLTQNPNMIFQNTSDEEKIGLLSFHPKWFVEYCFRLFGRSVALSMLEADLQIPPLYVRLNTLRCSESRILEQLAQDGINVEKVGQLKYAYVVTGSKVSLIRTQCFKDGLFYIQDKASCFAAESANPQPGMMVLDVCAAPGAKTTYLSQLMQNRGVIYSLDYSRRRMRIWKNEVAHMGTEIAEPLIAEVCKPLPFALEADLVVIDPPCTSTGTFARSPSAKWRLTDRSIERMAELQWRMLENCAEYLKPEGTLIYSTCSITVEENELLIEQFLKWHKDFRLQEIKPRIGLPGLRGLGDCQRLYPHIHKCNGFFIAKLVKNKN